MGCWLILTIGLCAWQADELPTTTACLTTKTVVVRVGNIDGLLTTSIAARIPTPMPIDMSRWLETSSPLHTR